MTNADLHSIDHGEVTDALGESVKYPLRPLGRPQADLEHTLVQPVATIALVPGLKKRVASFQAVRRSLGLQLRRNISGQSRPYAARY